ncbi:MAG: DNA polymerase III subunit gamma/tau, partial [Proteobacteria bacterium]|nr:DNA polymerase III subunit gamma/tau [Pseudomonadota bacterium]
MTDQTETDQSEYTVLARKYRPTSFDGLIGQEAMVRTLANAIEAGRLAHAFVLTGVRGVGKTTTARIIARVLNCIGEDGKGGPTAQPCGVCEHCLAISEDRHVDVLEMDAASRTGVDDIRELIESVRYRPTSARYKVYIIDEVHMLSKNAFNALLKTLEEPPEHVKFIFATTEIRKIPVTVLSRCQRFDLRRIDTEALSAHFRSIAEAENASIDDEALALIARAADGSVRDGLSLLDQAISHGSGETDAAQVRDMLGLADRSQTFEVLEAVLQGDAAVALKLFEQQYRDGADPAAVIEDMLEIAHLVTRIKIVPAAAEDPSVPEIERVRGKDFAARLKMADIARVWQMLLKGLGEVRSAPSPVQAAEMILVRLAYVADLPTPAETIEKLKSETPQPSATSSVNAAPASTANAAPAPQMESTPQPSMPVPDPAPDQPRAQIAVGDDGPLMEVAEAAPQPEVMTDPVPDAQPEPAEDEVADPILSDPKSLQEVAQLAGDCRKAILRANIINNVHLVRFEPGSIEIRPGQHAPKELPYELASFLTDNTARRW